MPKEASNQATKAYNQPINYKRIKRNRGECSPPKAGASGNDRKQE